MEVRVLFFGVLVDVTGTSLKSYRDVKSVSDLMFRVKDEFPEIVHYNYRISVNNHMADNDPILSDGDEIALMPPFAGG